MFFNITDPPYQCDVAYSDGYKPRYSIVDNGMIIYELNGGSLFALKAGTVVINYPYKIRLPLTMRSH